ncbi:MAG: hypothetical protein ABI648_15740 [Betaproteobacteria bacterium]|jgi:hypothetical protein
MATSALTMKHGSGITPAWQNSAVTEMHVVVVIVDGSDARVISLG